MVGWPNAISFFLHGLYETRAVCEKVDSLGVAKWMIDKIHT